MRTLLILSIAIFGMSMSCKKKSRCSRSYTFDQPISVYPVQDSYNIGDTIWIEMNFTDIFELYYGDLENGTFSCSTTAKLQDFDFHRNFLKIYELSNTSLPVDDQPYAWESFQFDLTTGNLLYMVEGGIVYKLDYENNTYSLKGYLICQQLGTFLLYPYFRRNNPNSSFGANEQNITDECEKEIIYEIRNPINQQSNSTYQTNYHIIEQSINPSIETDLERIKFRTFTIKVN